MPTAFQKVPRPERGCGLHEGVHSSFLKGKEKLYERGVLAFAQSSKQTCPAIHGYF